MDIFLFLLGLVCFIAFVLPTAVIMAVKWGQYLIKRYNVDL